MATIAATNRTNFLAAITSASGGDIITLAPGNYGSITISKNFGTTCTIRALDPDDRPVLTYLYLSGADYIRFEHIDVVYTFAGEAEHFQTCEMAGATNLYFFKCGFWGDNDGSGFPTGRGFYIINSSYITAEKCLITGFGTNVVSTESDHVTITGCEIRDAASDGWTIGSTNDLTLTGNYVHDFRPNGPAGAHCDFGQLFTSGQSRTCKRVNISDNIMDIGSGAWTQSIFMRNEELDGAVGTDEAFRFEDFTVERNWIKNAHSWGIFIGECKNVSCKDNVLIAGTMNMSNAYNSYTVGAGEHGGNGTGIAIPILAMAQHTGTVTVTGNRWYGGSWSSASRISLPASTGSWTVSDNVLDKDTGGPARPAFSLGWTGDPEPELPVWTATTVTLRVAGA